MSIIEQLKQNDKPFGLMSKGMQVKAKKMDRKENFEVVNTKGNWQHCSHFTRKDFNYEFTYRLRQDYQSDRVVLYPITEDHNGLLGITAEHGGRILLHASVSCPDFIGYLYKGDRDIITNETNAYKRKSDDSLFRKINLDEINEYEIIIPTYVLFKRKQ